jgi:hypothetical protein
MLLWQKEYPQTATLDLIVSNVPVVPIVGRQGTICNTLLMFLMFGGVLCLR